MGSYKSFFGNWFGYTRRERRSAFILLIIILIVTGIRFIVPERKIILEEIPVVAPLPAFNRDTVPGMNPSPGYRHKFLNNAEIRKKMDLNSCDSASLESLPGIGPVLASRIIRYRNLIGGFAGVDQLIEVYGLPQETIDMNSGRLYADTSLIRKININGADFRELIRHPYFRKEEVSGIIKYRELDGNIESLRELVENRVISSESGKKLRPYIEFGNSVSGRKKEVVKDSKR